MKTSIVLLFLVFLNCSIGYSQSFRDTIWLKDRTEIPCNITTLNYEEKVLTFDKGGSSQVLVQRVKAFKWNGKMYHGEVNFRKIHCGDMPFVTYTEDHECFYEEVMEVPGKTAAEIYAGYRLWVAEYWKSATDVQKLDDSEYHTSVVKGIHRLVDWSWFGLGASSINVSLTFKARDGRYKLKVVALNYEGAPNQYNGYNPAELSPKYYLDPRDYFNFRNEARNVSWSACQQTNEFFRDVSTSIFVTVNEEEDDW
ncbi:MAG: DUF4468 domain-containing protein [Flavobacteriales bacterium]